MQATNDLFAGTWVLDAPASNFDPNHRPSEATMRFEPDGDGYVMYAEGVCDGKAVNERPQRLPLDGKEYPIPDVPGVTGISSRLDRHTIRAEGRSGGKVVGQASYVVSEDGQALTATVQGIDAQQRAFQTTVAWKRS